ncbi:hypothetical protein BJ165DRAFT_1351051 [Panaeolus papilionaceus]|nr:hypothetical protein BJ165DRAFT_1351051 [Panaeolus papilionaceus]
MFWDHNVKWCINAVGAAEIDFRFSILQPHTGYRHFKEGISSLKQVTGRDQRNIQCYIVPIVAGAVSLNFMTAIQALLDFRYLAQGPMISSDVCRMIDELLVIFHEFKKAIIDVGARQGEKHQKLTHWQIPKLEFMQSVASGIRLSGSAIQWSADTTEHAHIRLVKDPAQASNNQNYEAQIVRSLDHQDKIMNFVLATAMKEAGVEFKDRPISQELASEENRDQEKESDSTNDDMLTLSTLHSPLSINTYGITNYFYKVSVLKKGNNPFAKVPHCTVQSSPTTAFHLSRDPQLGILTVDEVAKKFGISDLLLAISHYLNKMEASRPNTFISEFDLEAPTPHPHFIVDKIQVWTSLHLQSTAYHYPHPITPPVTLKAEPHLGGHDSAIFCVDPSSQWPQSGLAGHVVADLHLVFHLVLPKSRGYVPDRFLVYVQPYVIDPQPNPRNRRMKGDFPNSNTGLYLLKRNSPQQHTPSLSGNIIPLDQLCALVDIVPNFGGKADERLTCKNSLAYSCECWLNKYFDKELFYALTL